MKYKNFEKLRDRNIPTFANINLLGPCNVDCYFCLGKDIDSVWGKMNHTKIHFNEWPNFWKYLSECKKTGIKNIYITGQNTDALIYKYLDELIETIKLNGFKCGLRTNGYLSLKKMHILKKCDANAGFSIHSLDAETNYKIMRRKDIPNWDKILNEMEHCRVSIVLNRHNQREINDLIEYIAQYKSVQYIQIRRICTDTREDYLYDDTEIYEKIFKIYKEKYNISRYFYGAECFNIYGKEVVFWRTVKTSIGSYNYYTDGSYTTDYFVIEGYQNNGLNYPASGVVPLEGFWRDGTP